MRKVMIECESPEDARKQALWACAIYRCEGGFWAFEDARDAADWRKQLTAADDKTDYSVSALADELADSRYADDGESAYGRPD